MRRGWANILTLNLMHDIVTGSKSVEEARKVYAENAAGHVMGRPALRRAAPVRGPAGRNGGPDESIIAGAMARQTAGKIKDMVTRLRGRTPSG